MEASLTPSSFYNESATAKNVPSLQLIDLYTGENTG
jgi:hypothetical protein